MGLFALLVILVLIYLMYQYHKTYQHGANDENCVGEGSCIYNPIDPGADGVLFDWGLHLQKYGKSLYRDPPLDPIEYEEAYRCCPT